MPPFLRLLACRLRINIRSALTREYLGGELRNGDRPTGKQIARHLEGVCTAVPRCVRKIYARANAGFYCWEAVEAYEKQNVSFIITASKTSRLREKLEKARWKASPKTDAEAQCEFQYQPEGWGKAYRFIALRYEKKDEAPKEQYQLMETADYIYRVFVTNMNEAIELLVWVYDQRAGAENLIKEANNDAGLAAHPSRQWAANCVHFQLAMLAYNLNCWLMLFQREEKTKVEDLQHTTSMVGHGHTLTTAWRTRHSCHGQVQAPAAAVANRPCDVSLPPASCL